MKNMTTHSNYIGSLICACFMGLGGLLGGCVAADEGTLDDLGENIGESRAELVQGACSATCSDGSQVSLSCTGWCEIDDQDCSNGPDDGSVYCEATGETESCNECLCTPNSCGPSQCGSVADGCGGSIYCGSCGPITPSPITPSECVTGVSLSCSGIGFEHHCFAQPSGSCASYTYSWSYMGQGYLNYTFQEYAEVFQPSNCDPNHNNTIIVVATGQDGSQASTWAELPCDSGGGA